MKYSSSYTAGGLLFDEVEAILPFIDQNDINLFLTIEAKENKYLKISTESGRKRIVTELKKRIAQSNTNFWSFYKLGTANEKKLLLFYLCVLTYQLIWDFHFKVTIPSFWTHRVKPDYEKYKMYLDELGSKNEDVNNWSPSTQKKCITNYVRMLGECGLVNGKLNKPDISNEFYCYFMQAQHSWALDIYFLTIPEKEAIANYCK